MDGINEQEVSEIARRAKEIGAERTVTAAVNAKAD
jgi:hypothetical protein